MKRIILQELGSVDLFQSDCDVVEVRENGVVLFRAEPFTTSDGLKGCRIIHPHDFDDGDEGDDGDPVECPQELDSGFLCAA